MKNKFKIMKRVIILFIVSLSVPVLAQNVKVVSAFNYLRDGRLDKAKESIDDAIEYPKTKDEPRTWLYKGNVYLAIAVTKEEKYKALHPNPLQVAYDAYQKTIELDNEYVQPSAMPPSPLLGLQIIGEQHYNRGVELYNNHEFAEAIKEFEKTRNINRIFNIQDTLATFNAAVCAIQIDDKEKAISFLRDLVSLKYNDPFIYSALSELYLEQKDFARATQVINTGRNRHPDDFNILIAETNLYLAQDEIEKAQNTLLAAIEKNPNNHILHFTLGSNYDRLSRNEKISDEERTMLMNKAEEAYEKALEINPNYFDAHYNMGALFYNEGVRLFEITDKITDLKLFEKEKVKFEALWNKALPCLEKAHQANPTDLPTLASLRTLYARLNKLEELQKINEIIKNIQQSQN